MPLEPPPTPTKNDCLTLFSLAECSVVTCMFHFRASRLSALALDGEDRMSATERGHVDLFSSGSFRFTSRLASLSWEAKIPNRAHCSVHLAVPLASLINQPSERHRLPTSRALLMTRSPLWRCAALLTLVVLRAKAQTSASLTKTSDLIPVLSGQQSTVKSGGVAAVLDPLEFSPDSPLSIASDAGFTGRDPTTPTGPKNDAASTQTMQPVTPAPTPTSTAASVPTTPTAATPAPVSTTSIPPTTSAPPTPTVTSNLRGSAAAPTSSPTSSPAVIAATSPSPASTSAAVATPSPVQTPASSSPCKGLEPMSVENVPGIFCVQGPNVCTGENKSGQCPGVSIGLPEGSHCGIVATGVYGCRRGPAPAQ
ncbi:hypothetical protein PybrP1_003151 [[Pythium] brassicae (nom. inval.)]|nr:hypothetical protein PybrP1_003151 [[Pythium] brassicae (nom. inval.)]